MHQTTFLYKSVVDYFGTQEKCAEAIGVTQSAVHQWVAGKSYMSGEIAFAVEKATEGKFKAIDLCAKRKTTPEPTHA
jgi:DNA-binding transcriptional regulator YdaS (Cro superfamily)